jgi:hypothetical protein
MYGGAKGLVVWYDAVANRAEATNNSTLREESIAVMLGHVHASARLMSVPDQGSTSHGPLSH